MVILGGLELVAAGYFIREHNKHKKEREQVEAEEARLRAERRRRRKQQQEASPDRPGRPDKKYDYVPPSAMKPSAAGNNLGVPPGPPGRASSQPPPGYASPPPGYPGQPHPHQPGPPAPQGYGYPPGQHPPGSPPQQQRPQGLAADYYNPDNKYGPGSRPSGPPGPGPQRPRRVDSDPRRSSDPNLPQNYPGYQTGYPEGVAELSADGPWMHGEWRTTHQTPHVRFNFPHDMPQPGDDPSTMSPPPAYRP